MGEAPILLDVSRLIWRQWTGRLPTGIDRVCLAYLEHFAPRARAVVQFRRFRRILSGRDSRRLFRLLGEETPHFRARLTAMLMVAVPGSAKGVEGALYLNVGHTGLDSPYLAPWLTAHRTKPVFLIHDLIPITHPQLCRPGEAERHRQRITRALASARGIIVNSADTKQELTRFGVRSGLATPPCLVAWLGVERSIPPEVADSSRAERPYFMMVGTIEARKNHQLVLGLWAELVARLGPEAPELIIVGQRGWEAQSAFDILDAPGPLSSHVHELRRCADRQLYALIGGARALLMPSFVEGFGLPLVEAIQLGTPVIASDLAVFREIAGDIPEYCNPAEPDHWFQAVIDYSKDGPKRREQLDRAAAFRAPSWEEHFSRVEAFLSSIC